MKTFDDQPYSTPSTSRSDIVSDDGSITPECRNALMSLNGPLGRMWINLYEFKQKNAIPVTDEEFLFAEQVLAMARKSGKPESEAPVRLRPVLDAFARNGWTLDDKRTGWRSDNDPLMWRSTAVLTRGEDVAAIYVKEVVSPSEEDLSEGLNFDIYTTCHGNWTCHLPDGSPMPVAQMLSDAAAWIDGMK